MKYLFSTFALIFSLVLIFQLMPAGSKAQESVDGFLETQSVRTSKLPLRTKYEIQEARVNAQTSSSLMPLTLTFPIKFRDVKLYISSEINAIEAIRNGRTHSGTDFSYRQASVGEKNLEIVSATSGKVVTVQRQAGSNNCGVHVIVQEQSTNLRFVYCHLQTGSIPSTLQVGDVIQEGAKLGIMGTTGNSSGVHLHFGIMTVAATSSEFLDGVVVRGMYLDALDGNYFNFKESTVPEGDKIAWAAGGTARSLPIKR